jgi:hypothetical protein
MEMWRTVRGRHFLRGPSGATGSSTPSIPSKDPAILPAKKKILTSESSMTSGPRKRTAVRRRGTRVAATTPDHQPHNCGSGSEFLPAKKKFLHLRAA